MHIAGMPDTQPNVLILKYNKSLKDIINVNTSRWKMIIAVPLVIIPFLLEEYSSMNITTSIAACQVSDESFDIFRLNATLDTCMHPSPNVVCDNDLSYTVYPFDREYLPFMGVLFVYLSLPLYVYWIMIKNGVYQQYNIVKLFHHSIYVTLDRGCVLWLKLALIYIHMLGYCILKWAIIEIIFIEHHKIQRCDVDMEGFLAFPPLLQLFRPLTVEMMSVYLFTRKVYSLRRNPLGSVDVKVFIKHTDDLANIRQIPKRDIEKSIDAWGRESRCNSCKKTHLGSKHLFNNFDGFVAWVNKDKIPIPEKMDEVV